MMYDRFTDTARKAMRRAKQEAKRFGHDYICSEHIIFLGKNRRGMVVSQQSVDVCLQIHDLHQFLADKLSSLFSVTPHFVRHAHVKTP